MKAHTVLGRASVLLACPALLLTLLLYLYPLFLRCSFPTPNSPATPGHHHGDNGLRSVSSSPGSAPFRLLALGDPQLEGDSSLPGRGEPFFKSLQETWTISRTSGISNDLTSLLSFLKIAFGHDIPRFFQYYRKKLDLLGNDYYLAHIYRTLHWWLEPTHVTVLGDLIGSQWVSDEEFERRGSRFWNTVFKHGRRVEDSITNVGSEEPLERDPAWSQRIINVAGNHDIGYAGDITSARLARFERTYGKVNWHIKFHLPSRNSSAATSEGLQSSEITPELHLIVLNNMNLDGPAYDQGLQWQTYDFINSEVLSTSRPVEDRTSSIIMLTHIPLHKEAGVCVDGPFFDYYESGLREQNHLSPSASGAITEGIFGISGRPNALANGVGRNGVILTGHDHEGCDVYHYISSDTDADTPKWRASRWKDSKAAVINKVARGIREITIRSMMGSFGGNAGLLSAWFDDNAGEWRFEYATCALGVQHIWWAVHVLDLIVLACAVITALLMICERLWTPATYGKESPARIRPKKSTPKLQVNGNALTPGRQRNSPVGKRRSKNNLKAAARP